MTSRRTLSRRQVVLLLGGATLTVTACGSSSPSPTAPPTGGSPGDKAGAISVNHGHVAVITAAELAGGALTLQIRGVSDHPHTVVFSAGDIVQIRDGARVSRVSSNDDAHTHVVSFN